MISNILVEIDPRIKLLIWLDLSKKDVICCFADVKSNFYTGKIPKISFRLNFFIKILINNFKNYIDF